jgi:hypothetical protein
MRWNNLFDSIGSRRKTNKDDNIERQEFTTYFKQKYTEHFRKSELFKADAKRRGRI